MLDPRKLLRIMYFNYLYSFSIASNSTIFVFVFQSCHVLLVTVFVLCIAYYMVYAQCQFLLPLCMVIAMCAFCPGVCQGKRLHARGFSNHYKSNQIDIAIATISCIPVH